MHIVYEGKRVTAGKILLALKNHKGIHLLLMLLSLTGGLLYLYMKQPLYLSRATIEFKSDASHPSTDLFGNSVSTATGMQTQIDILKSDTLLERTVRDLHMDIDYFLTRQYRTRALYRNLPFQVEDLQIGDPKLFGARFVIAPVSEKEYRLTLAPGMIERLGGIVPRLLPQRKSYSAKHRYGEKVVTPRFTLKVLRRKGVPFASGVYAFRALTTEALLQRIRRHLQIHPSSYMSQILTIAYRDTTPRRASDFVNRLVDNYLTHTQQELSQESEKILRFVTRQLRHVNGKLNTSQTQLQSFKADHTIADLRTQKEVLVHKLSDFEAQYRQAHLERQILSILNREVKKGKYERISAVSDRYPSLGTLYQSLQSLETEKAQKLARFTPEHPSVKTLQKSISRLKRSLVAISAGILEKARIREKNLAKAVREYRKQIRTLPQQEQQLANYRRLYELNDKIYNYLLQKQSQLSIEKASAVSDRRVLDRARPANIPVSPKASVVIALSLFAGLVLILLHTLLRALFDTKIKSTENVASITSLPLYGMIPYVSQKKRYNKAFVLDQPNAPASEAYRQIKNSLEYLGKGENGRVILVTSSVPNEGKTTFSANLAAIMGMGESSVLLLSLDLRRPELHHKFGLSNKMGMSDLLSERMQPEEVVWEHQTYSHLNIITSGRIPPNPAELIASQKMAALIERFRKEYDYIVIDTPPLHLASDATILMKYADVTLFVLKSEFSQERYVKEIEALSVKLRLRQAGFVLTAVKPRYNTQQVFDKRYIYYEAT